MLYNCTFRCIGIVAAGVTAVLSLGFGGCAIRNDKRVGTPSGTLQALNTPFSQPTVGEFYMISDGRIKRLLDTGRDLKGGGVWSSRAEQTFKVEERILLQQKSSRAGEENVDYHLVVNSASKTSLNDPYEFLEIINRPVSGLFYNRDAELKIAEWRTTLARAISESEGQSHSKTIVALCTGVVTARKAWVKMKLPDNQFSIVPFENFELATGVPLNWRTYQIFHNGRETIVQAEVRSKLVIMAEFQPLGHGRGITDPRVEFEMTAPFTISSIPK